MKYNQRAKKGGAKQFKKVVGRARMHATADQRVAIDSAMTSKRSQRHDFSCAKSLPRVLALARIIPYASRRPAVMKRITRLEKHLFNQRAPTSPLFRPGSGSQPSKSGDSTTSPDANACSSKRPCWVCIGRESGFWDFTCAKSIQGRLAGHASRQRWNQGGFDRDVCCIRKSNVGPPPPSIAASLVPGCSRQ